MASSSDNTLEVGGRWINLFLLEDLFCSSSSSDPPTVMVESIWNRMPQALVEEVLLFLPASSQARFQKVCKRWRHLITSPAFREKTTSIAFSRGVYPCVLKLGRSTPYSMENHGEDAGAEGDDELEQLVDLFFTPEFDKRGAEAFLNNDARRADAVDEAIGRWCKWRRVKIPGLVLPRGTKTLFTASSVPLVGVACARGGGLHWRVRCWVIHIARQTFQELPPLDVVCASMDFSLDRHIWLVGTGTTGTTGTHDFRVFLLAVDTTPAPARMHIYSSASGEWWTASLRPHAPPVGPPPVLPPPVQTVLLSKGSHTSTVTASMVTGFPGYRFGDQRADILLSDADSQSQDVFALGCRSPLNWAMGTPWPGPEAWAGGLYLSKLESCVEDESSASTTHWWWQRLFCHKQPQPWITPVLATLIKAQIFGPMVLALAEFYDNADTYYPYNYWAMAYHLLDGSCRWQRVHRDMVIEDLARSPGCLFVSPLVSMCRPA